MTEKHLLSASNLNFVTIYEVNDSFSHSSRCELRIAASSSVYCTLAIEIIDIEIEIIEIIDCLLFL
jgi:hypothetical protein